MPSPHPTAADTARTPLVFCIVVNWNGCRDTLPCLEALASQDYPALHTVVVDNGSTDDSIARIRAGFPSVAILKTGANLGFPSGCNVGMRYAWHHGADLLWLLNNDTIAPPDTCSKLVVRALAEPQAGIIGSVLYYMHAPAQVQAWGGGSINLNLGRSIHFTAPAAFGPRGYLTFASALVTRKLVDSIGILYEGFFMYWDDVDLALRSTRAGFSLTIAEDTAVLHKEGGSAQQRSPLIDRYSTTAGLRFLKRQAPTPLLSMSIFAANKFAIRIARGHFANARAVLSGIGDYLRQRHIAYTDQL